VLKGFGFIVVSLRPFLGSFSSIVGKIALPQIISSIPYGGFSVLYYFRGGADKLTDWA